VIAEDGNHSSAWRAVDEIPDLVALVYQKKGIALFF
jgi:hypothetical protein